MTRLSRNPYLVAAINFVASSAICLTLRQNMGVPYMILIVGATTALSFVGSLRLRSKATF